VQAGSGEGGVEAHHGRPATAALLFDTKPAFAGAIADVLYDAVSGARSFYSDFAGEVTDRNEYMARYLDNDNATDEQMVAYFKERDPGASTSTSATGVYTPGRDKCRAEPFDKGRKTSCGTCKKGYNSSEKYSDGALTLCCACARTKILGIVVLDRRETPQVLINALLTRFPWLPRYLFYDCVCGVFRCAMAKLPWMLRDPSVVSDRLHVCNHKCSHFYNANSYGDLDFKNTLTHEQRNASIRRMEAILREGVGLPGRLVLPDERIELLCRVALFLPPGGTGGGSGHRYRAGDATGRCRSQQGGHHQAPRHPADQF